MRTSHRTRRANVNPGSAFADITTPKKLPLGVWTRSHYSRSARQRSASTWTCILPDPLANEVAPMSVLIPFIAATIRADVEPPDISEVMSDVEQLLNDSIATEGFQVSSVPGPEPLLNLSEIDFDGLKKKFDQGRKRTETERLRRLIEGKLAQMMQLNSTRVDFQEKFERLISAYNAGSKNIEALFRELLDFAKDLTGEEQRAITHHCHIVETGNESFRFRHSTNTAKARIKSREQAKKAGRTGEATDEPF